MQAGLHSGLRGPADEYLAVLLTAPGDVSSDIFNAGASVAWHHFVTILRRAYPGAKLDYWRVGELQARGHVHFHFVLRGLRYLPFCGTPQRRIRDGVCCGKDGCLRQLALRAGFGSWVGVKRPRDYPGGVRSLGWYFSKYLLKHYQNSIGITKLVTFSQGWRVGWVARVKESTGRWLYGGPVGASWQVLGYAVEPSRETAGDGWYPPWWWRSWQRSRASEAVSEAWESPPASDTGGLVAAVDRWVTRP